MTAGPCDPTRLAIIERFRGPVTVLALVGELDIATGTDVVDAARRALRRQPARIVVDLAEITFLDLTGTRALMRCRRLSASKRCDFVLAQPSAAVQHMLDVSGLHAVFDIDDRTGMRAREATPG